MNGKLISYLKKATNIISELDKIVSEFRKFNENKIADNIDNIKDDLISSIKNSSLKLSSNELNEYQEFVGDIMKEKGIEEKHHLKQLPEIMQEVSKRWKESNSELNEYQEFVGDIMKEKGVKEKHHLKQLPEIMDEVSERWKKESSKKQALYWKEKDRKYSLSQDETQNSSCLCPRCKSPLMNKTYKMRAKLFVCSNPDCFFMIKKDDIIGLATNKITKKMKKRK